MNFIINSFIAISLYGTVESQICFKNKVVMRTVSDVYTKMVVQSYRGLCIGGSYVCIYTKNTPITSSRTRTVPQMKIISFCCEGYIRVDDSPYDSDIQCKPICMQGCINGYCKSPGQCSCNDGYVPAITESLKSLNNSCQPVCTKPCTYATCVAPETCNCDYGYANFTGTCKPVCTDPCHNGICSAPEICTCLPGYRKTDSNTCQPYCSHGCDNGFCSAPENCTCNPGYNISMDKDFLSTCQPVCNETCHNAACFWIMEYSAAVLVPLMMLVLVSALIWKCSPIVLCFPQRCYIVQAPAIPLPFETVQFSELESREREDKAVTHYK